MTLHGMWRWVRSSGWSNEKWPKDHSSYCSMFRKTFFFCINSFPCCLVHIFLLWRINLNTFNAEHTKSRNNRKNTRLYICTHGIYDGELDFGDHRIWSGGGERVKRDKKTQQDKQKKYIENDFPFVFGWREERWMKFRARKLIFNKKKFLSDNSLNPPLSHRTTVITHIFRRYWSLEDLTRVDLFSLLLFSSPLTTFSLS